MRTCPPPSPTQEMQRTFDRYKSVVIAVNLSGQEQQQAGVGVANEAEIWDMNQAWVEACILLDQWKEKLRSALMRCKVRNALKNLQEVGGRGGARGSAGCGRS